MQKFNLHISLFALILVFTGLGCSNSQQADTNAENKNPGNKKGPITLVIHGGAGGMSRDNMSEEARKIWKGKLKEALNKGYKVLENGGNAVDAVETAIKVMENDSFFNAGKGSVLTHQGNVEMDASIMRGVNKNAGAMAAVSTVKNPISGARAVMEKSKHVMLVSDGAEKFAREEGLLMEDSAYFFTYSSYRSLQRHIEKNKKQEGNDGVAFDKLGTVGAVALDKMGNLAAGTSTGGMTNKKYGRVGDSPIIGAGTYADNTSCAVSATGHGEYFIRNVVAYDVGAHMKYQNMTVKNAADTVIYHQLEELGGTGGIIALDRRGNFATPFNTSGMFRAYKQKGKEAQARIFK